MPFTFKPNISPNTTESGGPSLSFGGSTDDLMARARVEGASILELILYFVFGAACFISVLLFGYRYYLNSQIESAKAEISAQEQELEKFPIEEMRALSVRIKAIGQLTREHPYVNTAFRILEDSIENRIRYKSFNLNSIQGKYTLVIEATSPDYKSIAQQVDTLSNPPYSMYIPSIKVEGLSPDKEGNILFSMEMPISISGTLPEDVNLSYGVSSRASSTDDMSVGTTTDATSNASTTGNAPVVNTGGAPATFSFPR